MRKLGHGVSLFDADAKAGGMLRYGIPRYRLPADVLESEIKEILDLDIDFKPNQALGKDISLDQLKNDGFDAVFLGLGDQQSRRISLEGSGNIDEALFLRDNPDPFLGRDEGFATFPRENVPELDVETRIKDFQEITTGFSDETAVQEARRCLQCDLRLHLRCNFSPPAHWLIFDEEQIHQVPETEGVFQLLGADHQILSVKGAVNLRQDLLAALADNDTASFFEFEENKMYSQRESEVIQKYLQEHGEMPGDGADDLDDLF